MNFFTEFYSIDIGSHSTKVFAIEHGSRQQGYKIKYINSFQTPKGLITGSFSSPIIRSNKELFEFIMGIKRKIPSQINSCIVGLPDRWVKINILEIPFSERELTIKEYINWKIEKLLNISKNLDIIFDYQIVDTRKDENENENVYKCQVIVAMIKKNLLATLSQIFYELKIELLGFDMSSLGVYNLIEEKHPDNTVDQELVICHIGNETTNLRFFHSGKLVYERIIEVAGEEFTTNISKEYNISFEEAEKVKISEKWFPETIIDIFELINKRNLINSIFGNWIRELNVTFKFYQEKFRIIKIPKVFLTGGSALFEGLPNFISAYFETKCELYNPFNDLPLSHDLDASVKKFGPIYAPAISLLLD